MKFGRRLICILLLLCTFVRTGVGLVFCVGPTNGTCGPLITWSLDSDGCLTLSGVGEMNGAVPWSEHRDSIKKVIIEPGVTKITEGAFSGCNSLKAIHISGTVELIEPCSFENSGNIYDIYYDGSVENWLLLYAYCGDKELKSSVLNLPDGNVAIFGDCGSLVAWAFDGYGALTICGEGAMADLGNRLPWGSQKRSIKSVYIGKNITDICDFAFEGCSNLVTVVIGEEISRIGESAFKDCVNLKCVVFPKSIEVIGRNAFRNCTALSSVRIPETLISVGSGGFYGCNSVSEIYFGGSFEKWKTVGLDYGLPATARVICSDKTVLGYGECGVALQWAAATNGTLEISGIGDMYEYAETLPPWHGFSDSIKTVKIGQGVTSVGKNAFLSCENMSSVWLSASVKRIGENAFTNRKERIDIYYDLSKTDWENVDTSDISEQARLNIHFNSDLIKHNVSSVTMAASCENRGYTTYTCTCGMSYVDEYTSATGHSYSHKTVLPTCVERGYTEHVCGKCQSRYTDNYKAPTGEHAYSDERDKTCNTCDFVREIKIITTPMYRLYNPNSGEHFFTGASEERDNLVGYGWIYEGIAWNAPVYEGDPVYRLYNPNSGDHHYTMDVAERDWLVSLGWQYEGVCWNSADEVNVPQYRLWNPNADCGSHHYTSSAEERDWLVSLGWVWEGIGWYGMVD